MEETFKGNKVVRTGRGHDFKVIDRRGRHTYYEIKSGNSKLSEYQRKVKKKMGNRYKVRRYKFIDELLS